MFWILYLLGCYALFGATYYFYNFSLFHSLVSCALSGDNEGQNRIMDSIDKASENSILVQLISPCILFIFFWHGTFILIYMLIALWVIK